MVTEDDVRRVALSLPATTEKPSYGTPGFRVKDKLFARIREEGDVLVVWCEDLGEKDGLIASEPEKFFTTPHYDGHPPCSSASRHRRRRADRAAHRVVAPAAAPRQLVDVSPSTPAGSRPRAGAAVPHAARPRS